MQKLDLFTVLNFLGFEIDTGSSNDENKNFIF